ncbi:hypothetical protein FA95DRAFT_1313063 [Auriscalpium vulgare]|uniref:Uncharacterized protein n=1 Tax=Auriscalpium vulgare TaxID=40419 RepID=A0ACB8RSP5_9AGAM|nr:hypothetical protein FA95DRAFT_1313063 [Auriscalpium vulgare]
MVREESSDKASTKEEESGSPRPASFESELTRVEDIDASRQHDIRVGPRVALVQKISATALLWERDEQKRIEAERTQSGGGGDRDVGYEDHGEGSSNGRVRGWRETIRPTSPPPPSPHWTEIYDASPFSDIERPLR